MSSSVYRADHREKIRAADADRMRFLGERIDIRTLPPEWREVALLIRETRKIIKEMNHVASAAK